MTDKTFTGKEREREREREREKNAYLLHSNYKKTTLSNMQRKHHVH